MGLHAIRKKMRHPRTGTDFVQTFYVSDGHDVAPEAPGETPVLPAASRGTGDQTESHPTMEDQIAAWKKQKDSEANFPGPRPVAGSGMQMRQTPVTFWEKIRGKLQDIEFAVSDAILSGGRESEKYLVLEAEVRQNMKVHRYHERDLYNRCAELVKAGEEQEAVNWLKAYAMRLDKEYERASEGYLLARRNENKPANKRDSEILTLQEARWLTEYAKMEHERGRVAIAKILRHAGPEGDIRGTEKKLAEIWGSSSLHRGPYDWQRG